MLVTSCDPFKVYVYRDGLARFATVKYKEPTPHNLVGSILSTTSMIQYISCHAIHPCRIFVRKLIHMHFYFIYSRH